jgi:glutathione S-transferase
MLTVHHLPVSQSERIVWLCEELGLAYEVKRYERDPVTHLSEDYRSIYPFGSAPVITDGDMTLGETGAIIEYLVRRYGGGRLIKAPGEVGWEDHLYWWHFGNATFMPALNLELTARWLWNGQDDPTLTALRAHWAERPLKCYRMIDRHLGENPYFAGTDFTTADIMMVFPLTTMRHWDPRDISDYPNVLAYLRRIGERPAYRQAMEKAEPGFAPLLD